MMFRTRTGKAMTSTKPNTSADATLYVPPGMNPPL
jgi:hypothetical protein